MVRSQNKEETYKLHTSEFKMVNEILQGADPAALDIEGKTGPENRAGDNVEHLEK